MILKKHLKSFIQSCNFNLIGLLKLRKQQFFRNSSPSAGWEEEETMLALLIKSPLNWHIKKWNGYNVVRVIQLSRVSRTFAALQILFFIFLLKWGIKWTRFWNSSWNIEFSYYWVQFIPILNVFYLKLKNILLYLNRVLFYNFLHLVILKALFQRWSTLWNSTLKMAMLFQRYLTLLVSTFHYTKLICRFSML